MKELGSGYGLHHRVIAAQPLGMASSVGKMKIVAQFPLLPSFPSSLMEWVQPGAWGVITTLLAVNRLEIKASEARQAKRTDQLRADMNRQMGDLRADNRSLGKKMDRLLDALLAVQKI